MTRLMTFFRNSRHVFLYGMAMAMLVLALKWMQWKFLIADNSVDIYVGLIALFFTGLGIWVATQWAKGKTKTVVVEKEIYVPLEGEEINEAALKDLNLSRREKEILELLAKGNSNAEIGEQLFLSVSTVKTHVSNLLVKLDVKNRTQALAKAKLLRIIH